MTEMVEKVARAIFDSDLAHGICHNTWSDEPEIHKAQYREDARAAMKAMREPTWDMIEDGAWHDNDLEEVYGDWAAQRVHDDVRLRWQAMIDAALEAPDDQAH